MLSPLSRLYTRHTRSLSPLPSAIPLPLHSACSSPIAGGQDLLNRPYLSPMQHDIHMTWAGSMNHYKAGALVVWVEVLGHPSRGGWANESWWYCLIRNHPIRVGEEALRRELRHEARTRLLLVPLALLPHLYSSHSSQETRMIPGDTHEA